MNKIDRAVTASGAPTAHYRISVGNRIPELDGARGIAVLAVVVDHYFGEVAHGHLGPWLGWMGVTLFFVLSGFLIGSIILERKDSANFLSVFYTRRALRILPVYFLFLTVTLSFIWLWPATWAGEPLPAASYFTFTQNFVIAWRGSFGTVWLAPTWTLAVEEQFYLIVPLLIMLVPARMLLPMIITGIALCLLTRLLLHANGFDALSKLMLVSNGHILLAGVLAAYIQHRNIVIPRTLLLLSPLAAVAAFTMLVFAKGDVFALVLLGLVPLLFAAYILLAVQGWPGLLFLRSGILRAFGAISYCLYLIHRPVNGAMHGLILDGMPDIGTTQQALVTVAALVVSVSVATVSWFAMERPLLRLGRLAIYRTRPQATP